MSVATTDVTVQCPKCREFKTIKGVSAQGWVDWQSGTLIQKALPELSIDEREQLISGICPKCWNEMFPED